MTTTPTRSTRPRRMAALLVALAVVAGLSTACSSSGDDA